MIPNPVYIVLRNDIPLRGFSSVSKAQRWYVRELCGENDLFYDIMAIWQQIGDPPRETNILRSVSVSRFVGPITPQRVTEMVPLFHEIKIVPVEVEI